MHRTESLYMNCQIHLENGVYLTVQVKMEDNFIYQLQKAFFPCRIHSDPDMVAALIAGELVVLSIGIIENFWDVFVDLNVHEQTMAVSIRQEDEITLIFSGSFTKFLSISQDEISRIWNTFVFYYSDDVFTTYSNL